MLICYFSPVLRIKVMDLRRLRLHEQLNRKTFSYFNLNKIGVDQDSMFAPQNLTIENCFGAICQLLLDYINY